MVPTLVEDLEGRGVSLGHIENAFTLSIRQVYEAIKRATQALGPDEAEEPDPKHRDALNARRRIDQHLQPFLDNWVRKFKRSPVPRVRDMGTVMHLILREEINSLIEQVQSKEFPVILEYDTVLSMFSSLGRRRASGVVWVLPDDKGSQFHAEQEQHLLRICHHFGKLLRCPIQAPELVNGFYVTEMDTASFMEDILFERPKISPRIPLIFGGWDAFGVEEASILSYSLQRFSPMQTIALLILFDKQQMINHLQQVIVDKMKAGYAIDTVVMGRQELEDVLGSPDPPASLRSFVLARIDIARISPYNITGPVVSDLVFSGREEELRTLAGRVGMSSYSQTSWLNYRMTNPSFS